METKEKDVKQPMLWYWSQPEGGMSVEECEAIAREIVQQKTLVIMFV